MIGCPGVVGSGRWGSRGGWSQVIGGWGSRGSGVKVARWSRSGGDQGGRGSRGGKVKG